MLNVNFTFHFVYLYSLRLLFVLPKYPRLSLIIDKVSRASLKSNIIILQFFSSNKSIIIFKHLTVTSFIFNVLPNTVPLTFFFQYSQDIGVQKKQF